MSLNTIRAYRSRGSFPRVSGDEPRARDWVPSSLTFSPRERG